MLGNLEDAIPADAKEAARAGFIDLAMANDFGIDLGEVHPAVAHDGTHTTIMNGAHVRTRVPNGAAAIPTILSALEGNGIHVAAVSAARPSLDDVYLHYTGREFAAEDAAAA